VLLAGHYDTRETVKTATAVAYTEDSVSDLAIANTNNDNDKTLSFRKEETQSFQYIVEQSRWNWKDC